MTEPAPSPSRSPEGAPSEAASPRVDEEAAGAEMVPLPPSADVTPDATEMARRVRLLLLVTMSAWGFFTVRNALQGHLRLLALNSAGSLLCLLLLVWVRRRPERARLATHLMIGAALLGISGGAMLTGQGKSASLWYLSVAPPFAAYLLDRRSVWVWTLVTLTMIFAVPLTERWVTMEPELVIPASDLPMRMVILTGLLLAFALSTSRIHSRQVATMRDREATIRALWEDLARQKEALEKARDTAVAASRAKGDFLAMMSHEIRTPLNAVLGLTGVLLDGELAPEQRDLLQTIRSSGDGLLVLLNDILDFSKVEAGRLTMERAPFDAADCVEDALDLFAGAASEKGLDLSGEVADDLPAALEGDSGRVRQILVNLVSNAVKFTSRGGVHVVVGASRVEPDERGNDVEVRASVRDTGIGIRAEHIQHLFKPFTQVDASSTRRFGGTGLGLAICRVLAERMGGRAWVESERGVGSTFHFTFRARRLPGERPPRLVDGGRVAFVVTPRDGTRAALASQVAALGLEAVPCKDTVSVVAEVTHGMPHVVVVDGEIPQEEVRAALGEGFARVSVVVVSAAPLDSPERRALREAWGADQVIVHLPVRRAALREAVSHGLGLSERPPPVSLRPRVPVRAAPLRVLVAEDNPVNQRVVLLLLERLGYRAEVVGTGLEALEAVTARPYDVVFMDMRMPDLDGLEATRRIRTELPPELQPHIVALTANAMAEDRASCIAAGMNDFVSKPITAAELTRALRAVTRRPAADQPS